MRKFCRICFITSLFLTMAHAQQVSYTEVNVFGWGAAFNQGAPALADIDHDGYMDLLVGTDAGILWHLEQSTGDKFVLISRNFSNINVYSEAIPTFTNIDNNGLLDLVVGSNSDIDWFEQQEMNSYTFVHRSDNLISVNIGAHYTPTLADLNGDGLLELIIGDSSGNLTFFEQDSLNAGTFSLVTKNWLGWNGGSYAAPFLTDLNNDGLFDMLVGEINGNIHHLVQDSLVDTTFHEVSASFAGIDAGQSSVPCVADIDNDARLDLFIGEWFRGISHYEQADSASAEYNLIPEEVINVRDFGAQIGYTVGDIDNDGLLDMLVSAYHGYDNSYIVHLEQEQSGSLNFTLIDEAFNEILIGKYSHLTLFDINGNGRSDLFVGDGAGYVRRFEQDEPDSYQFSLRKEGFNNDMKVNQTSHLTFSDLDGDMLIDMIAGEGYGILHHYEQDSVNAVTFTEVSNHFLDLDVGYYSAPEFTDLDGDSLLDLIIGDLSGKLRYYEQDSLHSEHFSMVTLNFGPAPVGQQATPRFADINNDGRADLLIGERGGGITLHLRNEAMDLTPPDIPKNLAAQVDGNYVHLSWTASGAEDLMLYNIYRSNRNDTTVAEYVYSVDKKETTFTDSTIHSNAKYFYWLTALDINGNESEFSNVDSAEVVFTGIPSKNGAILESFELSQNYPNPFNPKTTILYQIDKADNVEIAVFNLVGEKVATLIDKHQAAGFYSIDFDASYLASGIYFYRLKTSAHCAYRKMQLIK